MGCTLFFLALLSYCSGVISQAAWTQPPSESVSPGQTAKLSCTVSGSVYNFQWHRQRPGKGPHFVLIGTTRGQGIPDRFTDSSSGNVRYLTITNVQFEDEAVYYCLSWTGSEWIFGGGTQLIFIDPNQPTSPPNVHLFPPSPEEKESKNKATLVCLVDGFRPPDITITWEADGTTVSNGVETTKPTKLNDEYVASSYLTVSPSDWESRPNYSCKVTHKGTDYVKSVSHSQCP